MKEIYIKEKFILETEADIEWLAENYTKLVSDFEGKFIAVKGKKILTTSDSLDKLLQWLNENNIDPRSVLVESITPRSFACIL